MGTYNEKHKTLKAIFCSRFWHNKFYYSTIYTFGAHILYDAVCSIKCLSNIQRQ